MVRKLLWVTVEPPDVNGGGGARRQFFLIEGLRRHLDVDILVADPSELTPSTGHRLRSRVLGRAVAPPLSQNEFGRRVERVLREGHFEACLVAHIETASALGRELLSTPELPMFVDLHNVYSRFYQQLGQHRIARSWRALEGQVIDSARATCVLSVEERDALPGHAETLPNGVDPGEWPSTTHPSSTGSRALAIFGAWQHSPNRIALEWFLRTSWPALRAQDPLLDLNVYGPGPLDRADPLPPGVHVHGRVTALVHALRMNAGVIVPIVKGVGTRVKFIEALASGVPVVSTSLGAEGYEVPRDMYWRADTSDEFVKACRWILDNQIDASRRALRGRELALASYSWDAIAGRLFRIVSGAVVADSQATPRPA